MSAWKNPNFKPADIKVEEANYHKVKAVWEFSSFGSQTPKHVLHVNRSRFPAGNETVLFNTGCPIPTVGFLKFNRHEATNVLLQYDPPVEGFDTNIAYF